MRPRRVVPGTTYLVTRRCVGRQFLLRPSEIVNRIVLFCLAYAARRYAMRVHAFCVLSNHYHLVVTDPRGEISKFMHRFDLTLAKSINAHLGRWESVFTSEQFNAVELIGAETVLEKIVYTLVNPVRAGLVRQAYQWPGLRSAARDFCGRVYRGSRTGIYFSRKGKVPPESSFTVSVPPDFAEMAREQFADLVEKHVEEEEGRIHSGFELGGREFAGKERVLAVSPYDTPTTKAKRRTLSPRVACSDKWRRIAALQRLKLFAENYRAALHRYRAGDRRTVFPAGTYWMRVFFGVRCEPIGRDPP